MKVLLSYQSIKLHIITTRQSYYLIICYSKWSIMVCGYIMAKTSTTWHILYSSSTMSCIMNYHETLQFIMLYLLNTVLSAFTILSMAIYSALISNIFPLIAYIHSQCTITYTIFGKQLTRYEYVVIVLGRSTRSYSSYLIQSQLY